MFDQVAFATLITAFVGGVLMVVFVGPVHAGHEIAVVPFVIGGMMLSVSAFIMATLAMIEAERK
jgi:VIT1/CCC1 family predicted Fe2+/Mn2+ transporter